MVWEKRRGRLDGHSRSADSREPGGGRTCVRGRVRRQGVIRPWSGGQNGK